ncbi:MAG: hypothetical protein ACXACY_19265 [Candidatus Hodarchaeales archaeon]|jgi:hypothetical protein
MAEIKEKLTAYDLKNKANNYVEREFNYIQVTVLEKMTDGLLFENIRQVEANEDTINQVYYDLSTDEKVAAVQDYVYINFFDFEFKNSTVAEGFAMLVVDKAGDVEDVEDMTHSFLPSGRVSGDSFEDYIKENFSDEVEEKNHNNNGDNYPMWNTCFEFRHEPSERVIQAAIDAGFGVIEGVDEFNTLLFVSGCGYSFYGAHWIPMYLNLPYNEDLKKEVEELEINYDGQ